MVSCGKDDSPDRNLYEIAMSNSNLSTFVAAVESANIDIKGLYLDDKSGVYDDPSKKYTVFAPTNAAFDALFASLGVAGIEDVDAATLTYFIQYHLVEGDKRSAFFTSEGSGYLATMAPETKSGSLTPNPLSMYFDAEGGTTLNGDVEITRSNGATNGVLHVIDKVIEFPSVYTFINIDPELARFKEALTALNSNGVTYDGIDDPLGSTYTVFAPNQQAFGQYLTDNGQTSFTGINSSTLQNDIETNIRSSQVIILSQFDNGDVITTSSGEDLDVSVQNVLGGSKVTLTDEKGKTATILSPNIQAANGVIHITDIVLRPN